MAVSRRLLLGSLATTSALAGCSGVELRLGEPGERASVRDVVEHLDARMAYLGSGRIETLERAVPASRPDRPAVERSIRTALRAMTLVGTLRELEPERQVHPAVQARLRASLPELDDAAGFAHQLVASLDPADRRSLRDELREDPALLLRVFEELDREAALGRVPLGSRLAMRRIALHVSTRLKQSPDLFLDDLGRRLDALPHASDPAQYERRVYAAHGVERALFANAGAQGGSPPGEAIVPPPGVYGPLPDLRISAEQETPAKKKADLLTYAKRNHHNGAYLLGFGLANAAAGAALMFVQPIAALVAANPTPAVVAIVVGIALLVDASSKRSAAAKL